MVVDAAEARAALEADRTDRIRTAAEAIREALAASRCRMVPVVQIAGAQITAGIEIEAEE